MVSLPYFCAKFFRKEKPIIKPKKGAVILVGGGDGDLELPHRMAKRLLYKMYAKDVFPLVSSLTTTIYQPLMIKRQLLVQEVLLASLMALRMRQNDKNHIGKN